MLRFQHCAEGQQDPRLQRKVRSVITVRDADRADPAARPKVGNIYSNELRYEYMPYGDFQISVWLLLQVVIAPAEVGVAAQL